MTINRLITLIMCNSRQSVPAQTKAQGSNNNADTNVVNIYETIMTHTPLVTVLLLIITLILLFHCVYKIYVLKVRSIKRNEQSKRITRVMSKLALDDRD